MSYACPPVTADESRALAGEVVALCEELETLACTPELADVALRLRRKAMVVCLHIASLTERNEAMKVSAANRAEQFSKRLACLVVENMASGFDPCGHFVYLLWGDNPDTPLYVGMSSNILGRLGAHLGNSEKRLMVKRVQLIRCKTRPTMVLTEARLIREYRPPLNRVIPTAGTA